MWKLSFQLLKEIYQDNLIFQGCLLMHKWKVHNSLVTKEVSWRQEAARLKMPKGKKIPRRMVFLKSLSSQILLLLFYFSGGWSFRNFIFRQRRWIEK